MRLVRTNLRPSNAIKAPTWALWVYVALLFALSVALWPVGSVAGRGEASDPAPGPNLAALEHAFQQVVDQVSPSVVGIRARRHYVAASVDADDATGSTAVEQLVVVNGSGTIVRSEGLILTNQHVVQGASEIEIVLHDGRTLPALVVAGDPRSDLAVLHIDADGLQPARLCDWGEIARGQWSVAVGNPYGLGSDGRLSVSVGVISNLDRRLPGLGEVDDRLYADMIQTTASVHPGNSGGPLFNLKGELIGVVTAVHARSVDDDGVGFAIPMSPPRRRIIDRLLAGRPVEYGYLGLTARVLEPRERTASGLADEAAVFVDEVEADGPASQAGVRIGDVVTHYDGRPVDAPLLLADMVGQTPVGQVVELRLIRDKAPVMLQATVALRQLTRVSWLRNGAILWRGMRLADLSPETRQYVNTTGDATGVVVIDVREGTAAQRARLQAGDVIEAVEGASVGQTTAFLQAVRGRPGPVLLQVRNRGPITVSP